MAQTELKLRLLQKDRDSPSGYKIVGYIHIDDDGISFSGDDNNAREMWYTDRPPADLIFSCTGFAFELGIKLNDEWFYEGNIVKDNEYDSNGIIDRDIYGAWIVTWDEGDDELLNVVVNNITNIGNIHEEDIDD